MSGPGKVVIVTGASSGIGRACAQALHARGHRVYGASRTAGQGSAEYAHLAMDVTRDESVAQAVGELLKREQRIDVVVNSAGYGLAGAVEDTSPEEARQQFETNFFGALRVIQAVLPHMRSQKAGLIINVSSLGGAIGLPFQGLYSASKFAMEGLTESLRQEVRPFGIRATLIQPGDVQTRITDNRVRTRSSGGGSPYAEHFQRTLEVIEREERKGAPPEAVAQLVLGLLEEKEPRVRYTVGHLGQRLSTLAKLLLPSKAFEKSLMSFYGL